MRRVRDGGVMSTLPDEFTLLITESSIANGVRDDSDHCAVALEVKAFALRSGVALDRVVVEVDAAIVYWSSDEQRDPDHEVYRHDGFDFVEGFDAGTEVEPSFVTFVRIH